MTTPNLTFDGVKSFATYANAQKKLVKVLGANPREDYGVNTLIGVQPQADGSVRFVPVVIYNERSRINAGGIAAAGIFITN